jgi:hypothetical protein
MALGQASAPSEPPPTKPSVLESTFVTKDSLFGEGKIHFHEEDGKLTKDEKWKDEGGSQSVSYEKVHYVEVSADSSTPMALKRYVYIEATDGFLFATFRTEMEAKAVADYVGRKSSLDFIGGAWRVRKPFQSFSGQTASGLLPVRASRNCLTMTSWRSINSIICETHRLTAHTFVSAKIQRGSF